jgi:hypothetical protein
MGSGSCTGFERRMLAGTVASTRESRLDKEGEVTCKKKKKKKKRKNRLWDQERYCQGDTVVASFVRGGERRGRHRGHLAQERKGKWELERRGRIED